MIQITRSMENYLQRWNFLERKNSRLLLKTNSCVYFSDVIYVRPKSLTITTYFFGRIYNVVNINT
jgi:hypothetical protein